MITRGAVRATVSPVNTVCRARVSPAVRAAAPTVCPSMLELMVDMVT